ncbi:hypothetical protein U2E24_18065, partial [Acinetobacter baumannii]|uniref:hypothetical protein n=3 Tax=Moraxellaceae TaxID=468 RepID=UPI00338DF9AB
LKVKSMKLNLRYLKMDKPQVSINKNSVQPSAEPKPTSQSSTYVESVRMTPERILNAVIKTTRQGGSSEH